MFSNKKRPVPSPRALRALYQLAYICSGTAVGLATLCAEEQRRRIQIVQKIVDNGRAIRQSPRYRQNIAVARDTGDDIVAASGGGSAAERRVRRRRRRSKGSGYSDEDTVEGPDSSSVVRKGHATARRPHHDNAPPRKREGAADIKPGTQVGYNGVSRRIPSFKSSTVRHVPAPVTSRIATRRRRNPQNAEHSKALRRAQGSAGTSHTTFTLRRWRVVAKASARDLKSNGDVPQNQTFVTRPAWRAESAVLTDQDPDLFGTRMYDPSIAEISQDVDLFFRSETANPDVPYWHDRRVSIAEELLSLALRKGSLGDIRSLSRWKSRNQFFSETDVRNICASCADLTNQCDQRDLLKLYIDIFNEESFCQLDPRTKVELGLGVLVNALEWNIDLEPSAILDRLFNDSLHQVDDNIIAQVLDEKCKELIAGGRCSLAVKLSITFADFSSHGVLYTSIVDGLFDTALRDNQLLDCASLIRWKAKHFDVAALQQQCDSLIKAGADQKAHGLLLKLFCNRQGPPFTMSAISKAVSHTSIATLAVVCSTDPSLGLEYRVFYRRLPKSMRPVVDERSAVMSLDAVWRTTRNLAAIEDLLSKVNARLLRSCDHEALRRVDEKVLEIYIAANKLDRALAIMARMQRTTEADTATMCLCALLFARKGAWELFNRLVETMKASKSFRFDGQTTRIFNKVIRTYLRQHSVEETWNFATMAINDLGLVPTRFTTEVILEELVGKKAMELVPKWLRFVEGLGYKFEFDAAAATLLLRRYYVDHRPSHIILMWLCRRAIYDSPSLAGEDVVGLIKQAIGYDLRRFFGKHSYWQREHAQMRLERLEEGKDNPLLPGYRTILPSTGNRNRNQLSFPEPPSQPQDVEPVTGVRQDSTLGRSDGTVESNNDANRSIAREPMEVSDVRVRYHASRNTADDVKVHMDGQGGHLAAWQAQDSLPKAIAVHAKHDNTSIATRGTTSYDPNLESLEPLENAPEQRHQEPGWSTPFSAHDRVPDLESLESLENATEQRRQEPGWFTPFSAQDRVDSEERGYRLIEALHDERMADATSSQHSSNQSLDTQESDDSPESLDEEEMQASFDELRDSYEVAGQRPGQREHEFDYRGLKKIESDMMLPFSLNQYEKVLDLYHESVDAAGVPASPMILEIAIEASLRLHSGEKTVANRIMSHARDAGMNVICAMGPMLIHEMKGMNSSDRVTVENLRRTVIDYYRNNDENGWLVKHHVGVTAADMLIRKRCPQYGLNILSAIYNSEWAKDRPLDCVALSVFLKGYITIQSLGGIRWVVKTVLERGIRIEKKFVNQLRYAVKGDFSEKMNKLSPEARPLLVSWVELCSERRVKQMWEIRKLGWKLVETINACTPEGRAIEHTLELSNITSDNSSPMVDRSSAEPNSNDDGVADEAVGVNEHGADVKNRLSEDREAEVSMQREQAESTPTYRKATSYIPFQSSEILATNFLDRKADQSRIAGKASAEANSNDDGVADEAVGLSEHGADVNNNLSKNREAEISIQREQAESTPTYRKATGYTAEQRFLDRKADQLRLLRREDSTSTRTQPVITPASSPAIKPRSSLAHGDGSVPYTPFSEHSVGVV